MGWYPVIRIANPLIPPCPSHPNPDRRLLRHLSHSPRSSIGCFVRPAPNGRFPKPTASSNPSVKGIFTALVVGPNCFRPRHHSTPVVAGRRFSMRQHHPASLPARISATVPSAPRSCARDVAAILAIFSREKGSKHPPTSAIASMPVCWIMSQKIPGRGYGNLASSILGFGFSVHHTSPPTDCPCP